jgi:hypothetical protein
MWFNDHKLVAFVEAETRWEWQWLTRLLPPLLKIRCLPIFMKKSEQREGLHVATITQSKFAHKIRAIIASAEKNNGIFTYISL